MSTLTTLKRFSAMINDPQRTPLFVQAIKKIVRPGDVVYDLGCGLGHLTLAALQAGAHRVYACEIDTQAIKIAKKNLAKYELAQRVLFFNALSSNVYLPEKVDVILAETLGSLGLNENILPFLSDARDRFLKKGGKIIPQKIKIEAAPVSWQVPSRKQLPRNHASPLIPFKIHSIPPTSLFAKPRLLIQLDLTKTKWMGIDCDTVFQVSRDGSFTGFAGWFEAHLADDLGINTSPFHSPTHWKQAFLENSKQEQVLKNQRIIFRLRIGPKKDFFSTESLVEWGYKIKY